MVCVDYRWFLGSLVDCVLVLVLFGGCLVVLGDCVLVFGGIIMVFVGDCIFVVVVVVVVVVNVPLFVRAGS